MIWKHALHPDCTFEPWWEAPEFPAQKAFPAGTQASESRHDAIVAGEGLPGLFAALRCATSGARVVVVHTARQVDLAGAGLGVVPVAPWLEGAVGAAFVPSPGERLRRSAAVRDELFASLAPLGARDGARRVGRYLGAANEAEVARLMAAAPEWVAAGEPPARWLGPEDQWQEVGSARYRGGLVEDSTAVCDPGIVARELLGRCRVAGVTFSRRIERAELHSEAEEWVLRSGTMVHRAPRVSISGDFTGKGPRYRLPATLPEPRGARALFAATEEIPAELGKILFPTGRVVAGASSRDPVFRLAPDGSRVLVSLPVRARADSPARHARTLYGRMLETFPHLRGIRLVRLWRGPVAGSGLVRRRKPGLEILPEVGFDCLDGRSVRGQERERARECPAASDAHSLEAR